MKDVDLVICVFACDTIERYKQEIMTTCRHYINKCLD